MIIKKLIKNFIFSVIILLILYYHFLGILTFFPLSEILNNEPIYTDDYSSHSSNAVEAKNNLLNHGRLWGYNPYFMAGYPGGFWPYSNHAAPLFLLLFPFFEDFFVFKLFILSTFLAFPLVIYFSAKKFGLSNMEGITVLILATLFWNLDPVVRIFEYFGAYSFVFISSLSVLITSLFYRFILKEKITDYLSLCLLLPVIFIFHAYSLIILIVPILTIYLLNLKKINFKKNVKLFLVLFLILISNYFWIEPLIKFKHYIEPFSATRGIFQTHGIKDIHDDFFYSPEMMVRAFIFFFGLSGIIILLMSKRNKNLGILYLFVFVPLSYLSFFGSSSEMGRALHPYRFVIPLICFLIIPSVKSLSYIYKNFMNSNRVKLFTFILMFILFIPYLTNPHYYPYSLGRTQVWASLPQTYYDLINWIKVNTNKSARILLEDSSFASGHQYYGSHLPTLFPFYTQREFIGGPFRYLEIIHRFSNFYDGSNLFNKPIDDYNQSELQKYFDYYNIKWIISWSNESKKVFEKYKGYINKINEIKKFSIYEVNRTPNFFLIGNGSLEADYDIIKVKNASFGEVVIKYHWLETLKTKPKLKIESFRVLDDPIGFIKVHNGNISSFIIYNP
jgi:hypothetical protein